MATFALIDGAGDVDRYWHLVARVLRENDHEVVAPDLSCDDDSADLGGTRTPSSMQSGMRLPES